jgi:asparagine synthase (glutamine-hydrolysing)
MCGLSGWFDTKGAKPADQALLRAMNDRIAHRGPDGDGFFFAPGLGLAHRRLAIIDLSTGDQPMAGSHTQIVFNGEIYNFQELRAELEAKGRRFRTRSDTEVILEAWEEWGPGALTRLGGMFAFALWDARSQELFLARDRLGEKPLYYSLLDSGELIFASELKALLVHPRFRREIDPQAVEDFFSLGYVADPKSIYAGARKAPAGAYLAFRRGSPARTVRYWSPTPRPSSGSQEDRAEELRARLAASVKSQMISDVPLGAFLSGGVDSSAVVANMAKASERPIRCFTIGFDDKEFDETEHADQVARRYGAVHRTKMVRMDDVGPIHDLPGIFDEPFGDSSALPTLHLARLTREEVTVALSGDAGDELFAGYRRYLFHSREEKFRALLPQSVRGPLFGALARLYPQMDWAPRAFRARHTFEELSRDTAHGFFDNVSVADRQLCFRLFSPALKKRLAGYSAVQVIADCFDSAPGEDVLAKAQYVDLMTWLPGDILAKVDRTAMSASLETRVPLLEPDLVDWALGLPADMKLHGAEGKYIFKKSLEPLLPHDILYRRKRGFSVPLKSWMAGWLGEEFERDIAAPDGLDASGLFDMGVVRRLLEQHRSGRRDHSRVLWQLWMFHNFLRRVHAAPAAAESVRSASFAE